MPERPHSRVIHDGHEIAGAHAGDFDAITRAGGLKVAARLDVRTGRAVVDEERAAWPAARDHAYEMDRITPPSIGVLQLPEFAYPADEWQGGSCGEVGRRSLLDPQLEPVRDHEPYRLTIRPGAGGDGADALQKDS